MKSFDIHLIRLPLDYQVLDPNRPKDQLNEFRIEVVHQASQASKIYASFGIKWPEFFLGMGCMGNSNPQTILTEIKALLCFLKERETSQSSSKEQTSILINTCELMVHPGYPTIDFGDEFARSQDRLNELKVLISDEFRIGLHNLGVELCSFKNFISS
jgi:hypothetical protein